MRFEHSLGIWNHGMLKYLLRVHFTIRFVVGTLEKIIIRMLHNPQPLYLHLTGWSVTQPSNEAVRQVFTMCVQIFLGIG